MGRKIIAFWKTKKHNPIKINWLLLANILIFQWLFVRLTRCEKKVIESFIMHEVSIMPNGGIGVGGRGKSVVYNWYSIQKWILPLSGWWGGFIYLNKKKRFYDITEPKKT